MTPKEVGAIVGAYTGMLCGRFSDLQEYAEKLFGCPVWTHEFGEEAFMTKLKDKAKPDFLRLAAWCSFNERRAK